MRRIPALCVMVVAVGALTAPADAGETLGFKIKKPGGEYQNVVSAHLDPGEKKTFKLKVTTPDPLPSAAYLEEQGDPEPAGYKSKYFRRDTNITAEVQQVGGYAFNLQPGHPKRFRMLIKAKSEGTATPFCRFLAAQSGEYGGNVVAVINDHPCKF